MSARTHAGPALLVVHGWPGAGKSTIAAAIAAELGWPVFAKDTVKEALLDTLGARDRAWSGELSRAACAVIVALAGDGLRAGRSCILEANFDPGAWSQPLRALAALARCAAQLHCVAEPATLLERLARRAHAAQRHAGHGDAALLEEMRARFSTGRQAALDLGVPVLTFDTGVVSATPQAQARVILGALARVCSAFGTPDAAPSLLA
ncbi:MAG: AAA family ATPase [Gammaproteobacteria bacterium]